MIQLDESTWHEVKQSMANYRAEIKRLREVLRPIPVSERLPKAGERVMVWDDKWQIAEISGAWGQFGWLVEAEELQVDQDPVERFTHWMPMPGEPKE